MKVFSERLKELRQEKNLSTIKLAKALDTSDATISRWENDKMEPSISNLKNIALFFKVTADYLIGLED